MSYLKAFWRGFREVFNNERLIVLGDLIAFIFLILILIIVPALCVVSTNLFI